MAWSVVVLKMEVYCGCARRIRKAIKSLYGVQGVVSVSAPEVGHVVIAGPSLDAWELRWRLQSALGRSVEVVRDGGAAEDDPPDNGRMVHLGPPQTGYAQPAYPPPYGYYYAAPQYSYGYGARQYVPNLAPACFNDDNPNGCCVMQ